MSALTRSIAAGAIAAGSLVFAGTSSAFTWSSPTDVSSPNSGDITRFEFPAIATDSTGVTTVAWAGKTSGTDNYIRVARRSAGPNGTFGPITDLNAGTGRAEKPKIVVDDAGVVTLVWEAPSASGQPDVLWAARYSGGSWSTPVAISNPPTQQVVEFSMAVHGPTGDVTVIWGDGMQGTLVVRYSGGTWGTEQRLSTVNFPANHKLAVHPSSGDVTAVWTESNTPLKSATYSVSGGAWGTVESFSTDVTVQHPIPWPVATASGEVVVIWGNLTSNTPSTRNVLAARRASDGTWSAPEVVDADANGGFGAADQGRPKLALTADGTVTAVYSKATTGNTSLDIYSSQYTGGAWTTPVNVSSTAESEKGFAVASTDARVFAVWNRPVAGIAPIQIATLTGGTWDSPTDVDATAYSWMPTVQASPSGTPQVAWYNGSGGSVLKYTTSTDVPGAPTGVTGTYGPGSITVSWTAPGADGGAAITGYTAAAGSSTCQTTAPATSCTITGLTNGQAYTPSVTATNSVGNGPAGVAANAITPMTVPDPPGSAGITITPGDGVIDVSWSAPANDGGSAITGYEVTATPGARVAMRNGGGTCAATAPATSCSITGLTNGVRYDVTIKSINSEGRSAASTSVSASPAAPAVPAPEETPPPSGSTPAEATAGSTSGASPAASTPRTPFVHSLRAPTTRTATTPALRGTTRRVHRLQFDEVGKYTFIYTNSRTGKRVAQRAGTAIGYRVLDRDCSAPVLDNSKAGRRLVLRSYMNPAAVRRAGDNLSLRIVLRRPDGTLADVAVGTDGTVSMSAS